MKLTKEDYKTLYQQKAIPTLVEVPPLKFITILGQGDPNGPEFAEATQALYALAYAIKMSYKKPNPPKGYYEYTVFPLEGEWDLVDKTKPVSDKSNYAYKLMIQQPDFIDEELFNHFLKEVQKKKDNPKLSLLRYEELSEGKCCQVLHVGPYAEEPTSFKKMQEFCDSKGVIRSYKGHREIYLSDPRKTDPSKMKTILRFKVSGTPK